MFPKVLLTGNQIFKYMMSLWELFLFKSLHNLLLALRRWRQEDQEFKSNLSYKYSLRLAKAI